LHQRDANRLTDLRADNRRCVVVQSGAAELRAKALQLNTELSYDFVQSGGFEEAPAGREAKYVKSIGVSFADPVVGVPGIPEF
jgi:hypothetical protein